MAVMSRRQFVQTSAMAAGATAWMRGAQASPFGLPIGLQLYSVRELLPKDYAGTLKQVAALGYREVEAAGFYKHSAPEVKQALSDAGLSMPSAHYSLGDLQKDFDSILEFHKALGTAYIICSFPWLKNPERLKDTTYPTIVQAFTMEDWHWNAEQFNALGAKVKAAGMKFGYHNHTMEFVATNGAIPFDELLRLTDPSLVTIEMDCGWVHVGGGDPIDLLHRYPTRISMLHVKDFKKTDKPATVIAPPPAAELGTGTVDYHAIFAAAKKANIQHYFVEQEEFNLPPMESLKIDADYMKSFKA